MNGITNHSRPSVRRAAALVLATVVAGGCATAGATRPRRAPAVPGAWSSSPGGTTATSEDLARWWESLHDPVLTGIVDRALKGSPDVRTAAARLRQARAQRNLARANLKPSVSGSGGASRNERTDADGSTTYSAGIDASWEPDVFGAGGSAVKAADADVGAAEADFHSTQVSLAAEVAVNYVDLRDAQARLRIAEANIDAQAETLQLTGWRAQAGLVSRVDVEQARTNLAQTRAQVPSLRTGIAEAEHRLAVLAGLPPGALAQELEAAAGVPAPADHVAVGIPAETLRQRPDVRAAERRIVAETERLAQRKAARYPSFSLRGSLGTDVVTGVVTGGTSVVGSLVASLAQTIFDGGRIRQQIEIQSAVQEQAVAAYEATVLIALENVENALVSLEQNRLRVGELTTALDAARSAAALARQQYEAGLADFQRVLDTQRSVLTVEETLAVTNANRTTSLIRLYKALGGGWSDAQPAAPASGTGNES